MANQNQIKKYLLHQIKNKHTKNNINDICILHEKVNRKT